MNHITIALAFIGFICKVQLVQAFHSGRPTEIGICTNTTNNIVSKFACLDGDQLYCCGADDKRQKCCTIEQFAEMHRSLLLVISILAVVIGVLAFLLFLCNIVTIGLSWGIRSEINAEASRGKITAEHKRRKARIAFAPK